jgi:prolyl-tRNA synthetase
VVEADSGAIGGSGSQEFMVDADSGEDAILVCEACRYAANVEKATSVLAPAPGLDEAPRPLERHRTPNVRTVEQLGAFFQGFPAARMAKTVVYKAVWKDKEEAVAVLMRGDLEINEVKLANALDCLSVALADDDTVRRATGAEPGFAGPVGLSVRLLADESVRDLRNFLCGGNQTDVHCLNANAGRDFPLPEFRELRKAHAGETCPRCRAHALRETRGIEVGHIFKLGTKYSQAMEATFTAADRSSQPFVMGCYGIGVSRIAAAAVEQNHDANGIVWPAPIAPYDATLVLVSGKDEAQKALAEELYAALGKAGVEVLFDDRDLSPGVKFKDADLVGMPLQITVGRDAKEGLVELKERRSGKVEKLRAGECVERLTSPASRCARSAPAPGQS